MSFEWIKVCKDTLHKNEISILAEELGVNTHEAFGWWFDLYQWADSHTADGMIKNTTLSLISLSACVPLRVLEILASPRVQWLVVHDGSDGKPPAVMFSNWERHNGNCAKKRAASARRMEKSRAKASK